MTAREVIEQIKALPPEERARVIDFVEEVRAQQHVHYADQKSFDDAAAWTLKEHAELCASSANERRRLSHAGAG